MTFKSGDKVRVVGSRRGSRHVGVETAIIRKHPATTFDAWLVDLLPDTGDGKDGHAAFLECHLELIDDEYDGHKTTTWDKCPWQPERVTASLGQEK